MAKFHVNPETQEISECRAAIKCRWGGDSKHFPTEKDARYAVEASLHHIQERQELERYRQKRGAVVHESAKDFGVSIEFAPAGTGAYHYFITFPNYATQVIGQIATRNPVKDIRKSLQKGNLKYSGKTYEVVEYKSKEDLDHVKKLRFETDSAISSARWSSGAN